MMPDDEKGRPGKSGPLQNQLPSDYHDMTLGHRSYRLRVEDNSPTGAWRRVTGRIWDIPPSLTAKLISALETIERRGYMPLILYREVLRQTKAPRCIWKPEKWDRGDRRGDYFAVCGQPLFGQFNQCEEHHIVSLSVWDSEYLADLRSS
jgi:hypothetical protein